MSLRSLDEEIELTGELGSGAQGRVLSGVQRSLGRAVAVKVIAGLDQDAAHERFAREARVMAQVGHPGIAGVLLHGTLRGRPALVMERVDGTDLGAVLKALRTGGRASVPGLHAALGDAELPWPDNTPWWRVAASMAADVAEALDHAHRSGVLHRDVKPSNVLVDRAGRVRLCDFGVAIETAHAQDEGAATAGSLAYLAPEVLQGAAASRTSEVFALGALLHELCALERRFPQRDPMAVLGAMERNEASALPRGLPAGLGAIVEKAAARSPEERYGSAGDLARDLRALLRGDPLAARPDRPWTRWGRALARHRRSAAVGLGALALVAGTLSLSQFERLRAAKRVRDAAAGAREQLRYGLEAISSALVETASADLEGQPLLDRTRRRLLRAGVAFGEELSASIEASDEELAGKVARVEAEARIGLARIERLLGNADDAAAQLAAFDDLAPKVPAAEAPGLVRRARYCAMTLAMQDPDAGAFTRAAERALEVLPRRIEDGWGWWLRASVLNGLAERALLEDDLEGALRCATAGVDEARALAAAARAGSGAAGSGDAMVASRELARIVGTRVAVHLRRGDLDAAAADLDESNAALALVPDSGPVRSMRAINADNLGAIADERGQVAEGIAARRQALALHAEDVAAFPDNLDHRFALARTASFMATGLRAQGAEAEAAAVFASAADNAALVARRRPQSWAAFELTARMALNEGQYAQKRKDHGTAASAFERSLAAATHLLSLDGNRAWALELQRAAWQSCAPFRLNKAPHRAVETLEDYVEAFPEDPGVYISCTNWVSIAAGRLAKEPKNSALVRRMDSQALDWLERAVELGFRNRDALEANRTIGRLKTSPRFKALLDGL